MPTGFKKTKEDCENEALLVGCRFVSSIYSGNLNDHNYECLTCFFKFPMRPNSIQQKRSCPECAKKRVGELSRINLELVRSTISERGWTYNSHFYKKGALWINATCPKSHTPKNKRWGDFQQNRGCRKCEDLKNGELSRTDVVFVKSTISDRGWAYNSHFYKNGALWINASCPRLHPAKDKKWDSFIRGAGCGKCYNLVRTIYLNENCKKLARALRQRLRNALKYFLKTKKISAVKDLGCTVEEAVKYLESKFHPNPETGETMTWKNHGIEGGWHIDHIKPLARCNLDTAEGQREACHYTNLQPLWWFDNLEKGAKYENA